ncbi:MAG: D-alanine--poly(phosphoribitol) ligase [Telmatospirillum sp.]|nr:D-alanine--poly(phosphoribitol) ligase [Telmatospirillum sp.]
MKALHHLVAEQARTRPSAVAVEGPDGRRTYADLDADADLLAALLVADGVGIGDRILLWAEKSTVVVAAMQAALRIGAVYVPVDPMSPHSRLAKIATDSRATAIVTTAQRADGLAANGLDRLALIVLDDEDHPQFWRRPTDRPAGLAPVERDLDDLAYILYTSGSTGVPKGVSISHRNAMAFVEWAAVAFAMTDRDRLSNHAPFHFDLSVLDLYCAFLTGASVHIVPEGTSFSPSSLVDFLHERKITVWYSVPSVLIMMMRQGALLEAGPGDLRVLLFAGEPFPIKHLRDLREAWPAVRMANLYGPTETNVCTAYEVGTIEPDRLLPVPIGSAVSGDRVYAVNAEGTICGEGEEGELVVEGPTVMLGYFGRDPQGGAPYRTGDVVRQLPGGDYVYIGRRDDMLKVRGFRIERGEVEAALLDHPGIREAAVIAVGSGMDSALWAFLVPAGDRPPTLLDIKRHCAERLPRSMIVDAVRFLDRLPLNRNGKTDRFALEALATDLVGEG